MRTYQYSGTAVFDPEDFKGLYTEINTEVDDYLNRKVEQKAKNNSFYETGDMVTKEDMNYFLARVLELSRKLSNLEKRLGIVEDNQDDW